ncbi:uncharacterized protein LOC111639750 isoform X1 [Centruroides sculpturatus]|uniref:uncharacterized protein LOC111639750 isoform X1 n=1 Tax=Centruroides sculpturatus TaxID=218467 RepID=UPI000C6DA9D0|nr:uncharacterized protein LOC111639750 isoform X1 [Centruroides sculpturatus]
MSFFELIKGIEFSFNDNTGNLNQYTDTFLTRFKLRNRLLTKKDSYRLPNKKKYKIDDYVRIFDFVIYGLCSMIRISDCTFSFLEEAIKVNGLFSVRDVRLMAKFDFSSLFALGGHFEATLSSMDVKVILVVTEHCLEVKSLQILKLGHYEVIKITGINNALAWATKLWINASVDPTLKRKIINSIEHIATESLKSILSTYIVPLPVRIYIGLYKQRKQLIKYSLCLIPFVLIYFYSLLRFFTQYIGLC